MHSEYSSYCHVQLKCGSTGIACGNRKTTSHTDICVLQVQLLRHFWPFIITKNMRKKKKLKGDMMLGNEAGVIKFVQI